MIELNKGYNKYSNIRKVTWEIVDYLINNNKNLFKLLYYKDNTPLSNPDLTIEQIQNMICKNPEVEDTSLN